MSTDNPTVSLGMPVYNGERFMEEAIDSLLAQSFNDFELVISDNASTDKTESICRAYSAKDERIRYFRNRANYGFAFNFNNVFRMTSGKYFKWAASDDVCGQDYLTRAVEILDKDPSVVLAWGRTRGIDEEGDIVDVVPEISDLNAPGSMYSTEPIERFRRLMSDIWWADGPFGGIMRSDVLAQTRLHRKHLSGDKILLAEMCLRGRFYEIPEDLFFKRVRSDRHADPPSLRRRAEFALGKPIERSGFLWWRLIRPYPERLLFYRDAIARAPISRGERWSCYVEVVKQFLTWFALRGGETLTGRLPWGRARD